MKAAADPECRMNPGLNNTSFQYLYISVCYVVSVQCTLCCECAVYTMLRVCFNLCNVRYVVNV